MNKSIKNLLEKIIETKNLAISVVQCYDGIDLLKEIIDDQKNGNFIDLNFLVFFIFHRIS